MRIATLLLAVVMTGCSSVFPIQLRSRVYEADLLPYTVDGTGFIAGQALHRSRDGIVVTCAGEDAALLPAIPIVEEAIDIWEAGDTIYVKNLERPNVSGSVRFSRCDAGGNFVFGKLPPLEYVLMAPVTWQWGNQYGTRKEGGWLARRISVREGEGKRIILSDRDGIGDVAEPWQLWNRLN